MRIGAIDVGTNSVHLLIADVHADGTWDVVEKSRQQVELGADGLQENKLSDAAFERGLQAMRTFAKAARSFKTQDIICAATSAVREAANGADWCRAVKDETGIRVRTIPGREEGRLIYLGARTDLDFSLGKVMLLDLGGGSTEFIICDSETPLSIDSLPIGHIRLSDMFHNEDPMDSASYSDLKKYIKSILQPLTHKIKKRDFHTLTGTSGTLRCLALMATLARGDEPPEHSHGLIITQAEITTLTRQLRASTQEDLLLIPGMDPRRQRTITAGAIIVRQVMRAWDVEQLMTSERSLRDGLIVRWILENRPEIELLSSVPNPRDRSIQCMIERYGADKNHANCVKKHSLSLFDDLAPIHRLGFGAREILGYAALVHDIGHHISGKSHNKHGQYLVRHTRMHGFTSQEISFLGALVRYHRGSKPKLEHPEFTALSPEDRQTLRVLAGILRIADGLDRAHDSCVAQLSTERKDGIVRITVQTDHPAHLEKWAIERRKDLLEAAIRQDIRVRFERVRPIG